MRSRHVTPATLARLAVELKRHAITHHRLADEAAVSRTMISHVLAGRTTSRNVVGTARRLIAAAKATGSTAPQAFARS